MGCSQSTIENKETLNQCKDREAFIKQSISAHHAFAAAHFTYAVALKNTGAAFSDYAQGELQFPGHLHRLPPPTSYDSPRPPLRPNSSRFKPHSNSIVGKVDYNKVADNGLKHRSSQLKRERGNENVPNSSLPFGSDGIVPWDFFFTSMEGVVGLNLAEIDGKSSGIGKPDIQRTMADEYDHSEHGGGGEKIKSGSGGQRVVVESEEEPPLSSMKEKVQNNMNWLQVITELDDRFVKASDSAHEVSKILEADNLADNPGQTYLFTKVTRVTKRNRPFKQQIVSNEEDDYRHQDKQTHFMILDKILAWETKLHNEVKASEEMKYVYKKKIASLEKLTKQGASTNSLVRTKATVHHLHTRYIVQLESIDSTVLEINRLRDEQLYPKLVQLVEVMSVMWENMRKQHENQSKMAQALRIIKISQSHNETSEHNLSNTKQLHVHVKIWCYEFQKLILHQKEYVKSLNNWLKLNLKYIDSNFRDKVCSSKKPQNLKIQSLLRTWQDQLEKLPEEGAKTTINTFVAALDTMIHHQLDEKRMKEMSEETRREIKRKAQKFEEWCDKHIAKRTPTEELDLDVEDDIEVIAEHQIEVEALNRRLEEDEEAYRRKCLQVKDKSSMNLNTGLPDIVTTMLEFSLACSHMYESLKSHSKRRYSNGSS